MYTHITIHIYTCIFLKFYLFILAALDLRCCPRAFYSCGSRGFSLQWLLLLWSTGSRHVGFSSCGTWAQLLRSMWDLPGSGLEPMSSALAGGFLTTVPPEKPYMYVYMHFCTHIYIETQTVRAIKRIHLRRVSRNPLAVSPQFS